MSCIVTSMSAVTPGSLTEPSAAVTVNVAGIPGAGLKTTHSPSERWINAWAEPPGGAHGAPTRVTSNAQAGGGAVGSGEMLAKSESSVSPSGMR